MRVTIRQIRCLARATVVEAIRLRAGVVLAGAGIVLVALVFRLRELNFGAPELRFLLDTAFGVIGLGGTLFAVLATTHLVCSDIERGSIQFILVRPVPRFVYLAGRLAGILAVLALYCAVLTAFAAALGSWRAAELRLVFPWMEVARAGSLLWMKAAVAAALALVVCTYARSALFANAIALLAVFAGHLRPLAVAGGGSWPAEGLAALLRLCPDFQLFEPTRGAAAGLLAGYGAGYLLMFLAVSAIVFRSREL